jgi:hypothetical protein
MFGQQTTTNFGQRLGGNQYPNRGGGPRPEAVSSQNFYHYNDRQEPTHQPEISNGPVLVGFPNDVHPIVTPSGFPIFHPSSSCVENGL